MANTFFEAPEYPILDKLRRCTELFAKQAYVVLGLLLFIRVWEIGFYIYTLPAMKNSMFLVAEGSYYTFIYFLKSLPILFIPYVIIFFSDIRGTVLKVSNYIIFAVYLSIELALARYFYQTKTLLAENIFVKGGIDFSRWSIFGFYWLACLVVVFVMLWFILLAAKHIRFIDSAFSFFMVIVGIILLLFDVSAVPNYNGKIGFKIMVPKSAYLIENSFTLYFEEEPKVDIYQENYYD